MTISAPTTRRAGFLLFACLGLAAASAGDCLAIQPIKSQPHLTSGEIAEFYRSRNVANAAAGPTDPLVADAKSTDAVQDEIQQWIEQLGASGFAQRERATSALVAMGGEALPAISLAAAEHPDAETRSRAGDIAEGMIRSRVASRVEAFLSGQDVDFPGWTVARRILGDSVRIRELFVSAMQDHGGLIESLDGTAEARTGELRAAILRIQNGLMVQRRFLTEADLISVLLVVGDPETSLAEVEESLIAMLNRDPSARIMADPQLSGPFRAMIGAWVMRSGLANRDSIGWYVLAWDLPEALPLAMRTLDETDRPEILTGAMQAIARFGDESHIPKIVKYLDDARPVTDAQFDGESLSQVKLGDVAMVTVALLSKRKLSEFGWADHVTHGKFGFLIDEIGFPENDPKARQAVREKIERLLPKS